MKKTGIGRRAFIKDIAGSAAAMSILPAVPAGPAGARAAAPLRQAPPRIRFAVIGLNHGHIKSQTDAVLRGGGELTAVYAKEPDLLAAFVKRFPQAKAARTENEVLENTSIQ